MVPVTSVLRLTLDPAQIDVVALAPALGNGLTFRTALSVSTIVVAQIDVVDPEIVADHTMSRSGWQGSRWSARPVGTVRSLSAPRHWARRACEHWTVGDAGTPIEVAAGSPPMSSN